MRIHTAFITFNRLELTKRAIESYLETVRPPFDYVVVDNASTDGTREWLEAEDHPRILLDENRFPGFACNRGWEQASPEATVLHRADNDFVFLPDWQVALQEALYGGDLIGQVGLRTDEEELFAEFNVGGNCAIRRALWDRGLRYDERPWGESYPKGWTEDSLLSPAVRDMGYAWTRVRRPCIVPISTEDPDDPYYRRTWELRGIQAPRRRGARR